MEYIDSVLYKTNEIPFNKTFCTVIVFVVFDYSIGYDAFLFFDCNYFVNLLIIVPHFDFCNQFIIVFEKKLCFSYLMMAFVVLHLSYGWGSLNGIISVLKYGK